MPADGMAQTSARSMGQTMSAFKPGATMPAASVGAAMAAGDATSMGSPRAAAKGTMTTAMGNASRVAGNAPTAMGNADTAVGRMSADLNTTMSTTGSRTSRTKFLKWFNSLSPRQGQVDDHELPQLERSRCFAWLFVQIAQVVERSMQAHQSDQPAVMQQAFSFPSCSITRQLSTSTWLNSP